jgi:hypothetical protein
MIFVKINLCFRYFLFLCCLAPLKSELERDGPFKTKNHFRFFKNTNQQTHTHTNFLMTQPSKAKEKKPPSKSRTITTEKVVDPSKLSRVTSFFGQSNPLKRERESVTTTEEDEHSLEPSEQDLLTPEEDQYSDPYVAKVGLKSLLSNHPELVPKIQDKAKEITRVALHLSRFINLFVLKCLEENVVIPKLDKGFLQRVKSVLFGPDSEPRNDNIELLNEFVDVDYYINDLYYPYEDLSKSMNYVCGNYVVNILNMLKFTFEQRLRKYLRLRMDELLGDNKTVSRTERRRVGEYIVRKLTYTKSVFDFIKLPPQELIDVIPVLIEEIQNLIGTDKPITEKFIEANNNRMFRFYWHIQKFFITKNVKSFALVPLSHFKCRCMEIGTQELVDMIQTKRSRGGQKKGAVKPELVPFNYNFKCLNFGKKEIRVDSIRTDGIQASVVIRHKLNREHKTQTEEPANKKRRVRMKPQADYLIGIDPGVVTLLSCADSDGKKWEFSNKHYHHLSHHTKNKKKLLKCKKVWNATNNKSLDELHNSIKQAGVSSSELFREHVQSVLKVEDDLLDFYCHPSVKRLNWDSYIMRAKTIAKVMKDFHKRSKGRKMIVGMGDAGFGSCYKGNDPAPKGKLLKKLNERFEVRMIDEFMTSQTCCACHSHLKPVKHKRMDKKGVSAISIVRGIKQCKTTGCLVTHNRDLNAAKNMLHLLQSEINGEERLEVFMRKKKLAKELHKKIDDSHEVLKSSRSSKR